MKLTGRIFAFIFIFIFLQTGAQTFEWAHNGTGAIRTDVANNVITDNDGNLYVTGYFNSPSITFGSVTLTNAGTTQEIFIVKYDSAGVVLWAKSVSGSDDDYGVSLALDAAGDLYVGGVFESNTVSFDTITINAAWGPHGFLAKYNSSGNILWVSPFYRASVSAIEIDAAGTIYVAGYHNHLATLGSFTLNQIDTSSVGDKDIFLARCSSAGTVLWATNAGSSSDEMISDIEVDNAGYIYMTGNLYGPATTFGSIVLNNNTNTSFFLVKYDSLANVVWANTSNGADNLSTYCLAAGIDSDPLGNIYINGTFDADTLIFGVDTLLNSYPGITVGPNVYITKYNSSGNVLLAISEPSASSRMEARALVIDYAGNLYHAGTDMSSSGYRATIIKKYSPSLVELWVQWATVLAMTPPHSNEPYSISADPFGHIFVGGGFVGNLINFGTTTLTNSTPSAGSYLDMYIAKLTAGTTAVWPGDANHDYIANNYDLLPLGLFYSQTGSPRTLISNSWSGYPSIDWGITQVNDQDVKHADCNGDSIINMNDTLAINLNYSLAHAFVPHDNDYRTTNPDLYFITSSGVYQAGDTIDVEIWVGSTTLPSSNLYGIAFDFIYDVSLVQPGTETLTFPVSWLGTPGIDVIKIGKIDPLVSMVHGAETRINQTNINGYGKIADFKFQAKSAIFSPMVMNFSLINYSANDSDGNLILYNTQPHSILINPYGTNVSESKNNVVVNVFPNPYSNSTQISYSLSKKSAVVLEVYNSIGEKVETIVNAEQDAGEYQYDFSASEKGFGAGIYLMKIEIDYKTSVKKLVQMK